MKRAMMVFVSLCLALTAVSCSTGKEVQKVLPLATIQLTPADGIVKIGDSLLITAKGLDMNGKGLVISPKWSLDPAGLKAGNLVPDVKASNQATFTAKQVGTALITVEANGIKATAKIVVSKTGAPVKKTVK